MNKYIAHLTILLLLVSIFAGCKAKKEANKKDTREQTALPKEQPGVDGVLKNMAGLDGCKWMIELANGDKLQPTNLAAFDITLVDGKKVFVDYVVQTGVMSTCMAGKVVKIIAIKER